MIRNSHEQTQKRSIIAKITAMAGTKNLSNIVKTKPFFVRIDLRENSARKELAAIYWQEIIRPVRLNWSDERRKDAFSPSDISFRASRLTGFRLVTKYTEDFVHKTVLKANENHEYLHFHSNRTGRNYSECNSVYIPKRRFVLRQAVTALDFTLPRAASE